MKKKHIEKKVAKINCSLPFIMFLENVSSSKMGRLLRDSSACHLVMQVLPLPIGSHCLKPSQLLYFAEQLKQVHCKKRGNFKLLPR